MRSIMKSFPGGLGGWIKWGQRGVVLAPVGKGNCDSRLVGRSSVLHEND